MARAAREPKPRTGQRRQIPHEPQPGSKVAEIKRERNPILRFAKILGPGFVTGASDDDPSGIATYATAGAALGFPILWVAPLTFPLSANIQFLCAKIAMVTGKGLAGVLRDRYPRWLLYPTVIALLVANTINVGSDLGAVAAAINLLIPGIPIGLLVVPVALGILGLQLFGSYRLIANVFRWLCLALLAYIGAAFFARPDWGAVLRGTLLPQLSLDRDFVTTLVAILGTTISPYLFFWQATHEVEAEVDMGRTRLWQRRGASDDELVYAAVDVNAGIGLSNLVMYFVILATAATLHAAGQTHIESATDAAQALRPIAGDLAAALLAVGLIGGGVLAIPILSGSAAYAMSEAAGWKYGLNEHPARAKQFYAVIAAATLVGVLINFLGINPIEALFATAVINGIVSPPLLILIMLISGNRAIMGKRTNNRLSTILGWLTAALMTVAAIVVVVTTVLG